MNHRWVLTLSCLLAAIVMASVPQGATALADHGVRSPGGSMVAVRAHGCR